MPECKTKKCKCSQKKRFVSHGISNSECCRDVCTNPICGTPDVLTLLAPVVYDELGINLCRTIPLTAADIPAQVCSASIQILDVTFSETPDAQTTIAPINGSPNCYLITLTNLVITFAVTYYDACGRVITIATIGATYLPTNDTVDGYDYVDDDTNPTSVELEIFAPYGPVYQDAATGSPVINYIGFSTTNNSLQQGIVMIAIPKLLNFDITEPSITVGVTLYVKSVYFSQYLVPHNGRAIVPKGSIIPDDDTICMDFVCGELLDYEIKPLELGPPKFEGQLKQDCMNNCGCSRITVGTGAGTGTAPAPAAIDS